jgi:hypothetical protein
VAIELDDEPRALAGGVDGAVENKILSAYNLGSLDLSPSGMIPIFRLHNLPRDLLATSNILFEQRSRQIPVHGVLVTS